MNCVNQKTKMCSDESTIVLEYGQPEVVITIEPEWSQYYYKPDVVITIDNPVKEVKIDSWTRFFKMPTTLL